MKLAEFQAQDNYCEANNTPEGMGCDGCPATDKSHCADALRNLAGKFLDALETKADTREIAKQIEKDYGFTAWNILALAKGELEFPE